MAKVKKTQQQIIAENEKISDQILEDLRSKGGDNMDGEKRANEKLVELGYKQHKSLFEFDDKAAENLDWFYHLTGGHTHTDFFAMRPTDYSKANEGEDFENIW